jgi:hypothetical protein
MVGVEVVQRRARKRRQNEGGDRTRKQLAGRPGGEMRLDRRTSDPRRTARARTRDLIVETTERPKR